MAAIDSLLGILDLQKADGLVLVQGRVPALLGGKGGGALTMPPLTPTMMSLLVGELLSAEDLAQMGQGAVIERPLPGGEPGRPFTMTARLEGEHPKIVIRRGPARGAARPASAPPAPVADTPAPPPRAPDIEAAPTGSLPPAVSRALDAGLARGASDVILSTGRAPLARRGGRIEPLGHEVLDDASLRALVESAPGRQAELDQHGSVDFALEHGPRRARFRVNVFRQQAGTAAVLRPIWDRIPSLQDLGLPAGLLRVVAAPSGLVLMTGPTGSGKSTTLAALVAHVARSRPCHIVTLEDPIECLFADGPAVVHQREIGTHVSSFAAGLRAALRESPDVLLLGEMRDPETILLALTAAETGHLVLSTLHAGSAAGAVERILHALPEVERVAVRTQLASALRFVLTQHLLPATDGDRVPVVEVLAVNHAVAAQIRDGRTQLLPTQIELGADEGMVTRNQALLELVRAGRISAQTALGAASNREELERLLGEARTAVRRS